MYAEVAWVLVSSGTQVQPQIILDPDYLPDYLSVSYDYVFIKQNSKTKVITFYTFQGIPDISTCETNNINFSKKTQIQKKV